jgi:hypothetical protein
VLTAADFGVDVEEIGAEVGIVTAQRDQESWFDCKGFRRV